MKGGYHKSMGGFDRQTLGKQSLGKSIGRWKVHWIVSGFCYIAQFFIIGLKLSASVSRAVTVL